MGSAWENGGGDRSQPHSEGTARRGLGETAAGNVVDELASDLFSMSLAANPILTDELEAVCVALLRILLQIGDVG